MAFQQLVFDSNNIGNMDPRWREQILNGSVKTDAKTLANARNWQFMNAAGYQQAATVNDIPAGSTTFALQGAATVGQNSASYGKDSRAQAVTPGPLQNWYKPPAAAAPAAPAAPSPSGAAAAPAEVKGGTTGTSGADKPFNISDYEAPKATGDEGYLDKYLANRKTDYDKFLEENKKSGVGNGATSNPQEDWKKYATDWGYSDIARRWDTDDRNSLTTDPQGNTVPRRASNTMAGGVDYVASLSGFGKYQRPYT